VSIRIVWQVKKEKGNEEDNLFRVCIDSRLHSGERATGAGADHTTAKVKTPSPELVGQLTRGLSIKPEQAVGGAGALFGLAKSRLNPGDFTKVANVVPDMGDS